MKTEKNQEQILTDKNKNGKNRNWRGRKLKNIELAKRLDDLGYRAFSRVYQCAEVLKFKLQADGSKKLYQAYFCKHKLCPMCNWRRAMKYSWQAELVVNEAIKREPKGRFIFLTLTVKNVKGEALSETMSKMTVGFNRLFKYKQVDKNVIGFLRSTEVTYSKDRHDYHPHLHVLLFVKSTYFARKGEYLTQSDWTDLWQKAMKLDYTPLVDVRAVKDKKGQGIKSAVLETAKYPVKPFDIERDKDGHVIVYTEQEKLQITDDLVNGLHRKRQIGFGKLFKTIKQELALDDVQDGNLIETSEGEKTTSTGQEIVAKWNWERSNYFVK